MTGCGKRPPTRSRIITSPTTTTRPWRTLHASASGENDDAGRTLIRISRVPRGHGSRPLRLVALERHADQDRVAPAGARGAVRDRRARTCRMATAAAELSGAELRGRLRLGPLPGC